MDDFEGTSVIESVNGVAEPQCFDDSRFSEPESMENGDLFGDSDNSSSTSETENEAEQPELAEDYPSDELVDNAESLSPVSPLESAASGDMSDHSMNSMKTDEEVDQVEFYPDFIIFNNIYARNALVRFSDNSVEANGLNVCTDQDEFDVQLKLDDIVSIESVWIERTHTAMVKIRVISEGSVETESGQSISDIKELRFAATDIDWIDKKDDMLSLDPRYEAKWTSYIDTETDPFDDMTFPTSYIPSFNPFEDFIYPKGDPDAVSMSKRDVDLLEPDTFVNDTIIDFYIKYLKDKIPPEKRQRFHFFNSFFFRKLGDLEKYPTSSFDGRAAFLRVRKWTRKVNLFEKDFIFVPINNHYHWSLVVICHPGEIASFTDLDTGKSAKVPCILHMDSIRGTHVDLECRIRSYLWEEWKGRQKETSEDVSAKFSNLRFVSLELPQQQNSYDCGLFLLHYVELFLEEDPVGINPFKISKLHKFLNDDWFPSAEPSLKRRAIQNLIRNLLDAQSDQNGQANKVITSDPIKLENGLEFLTSSFGQGKEGYNGDSTCSLAKNSAEMTVFPTHLNGSLCTGLSDISAGNLYNETGLHAQASVDVQYHTFDRISSFNDFGNAAVSVQETCGTYNYLEPKENGFHSSVTIKTEAHEFTSPSGQFNTEEMVSWDQEMCVGAILSNNLDSSTTMLPLTTAVCNDDNALHVVVAATDETPQNNQESVFIDEMLAVAESDGSIHIAKENEMVAVAESDKYIQGLEDSHELHQTTKQIATDETPQNNQETVLNGEMLAVAESDNSIHIAKENEVLAVAESDNSMQGHEDSHELHQATTQIASDETPQNNQESVLNGEMLAVAESENSIHIAEEIEVLAVSESDNFIHMLAVAESDRSMQGLEDSHELHQATTQIATDETPRNNQESVLNDEMLAVSEPDDSIHIAKEHEIVAVAVAATDETPQTNQESVPNDEMLAVAESDDSIHIAKENEMVAVAESDKSMEDSHELHQTTPQFAEENEIQAVAESDCSIQRLEVARDCTKDGRVRSINSDESDEQHVAKKARLSAESEECPKSLQEEDLCL